MTPEIERELSKAIRGEKRTLLLYIVSSTLLYTSSISLVAVSIVLISRSSFRPQILTLGVFIAATQYFAIGRSASRYLERVSSHRLVLASTGRLRLTIFRAARGLFPTDVSNLNRQAIVSGAMRGLDSATSLFLRLYLPMAQMAIVALFVVALGLFFDPVTSILIALLLVAMTIFAYRSSKGTMSRAADRHSRSLSTLESSISQLSLASEALHTTGVIDGAISAIDRRIVEHSRAESSFERRSFLASFLVISATQLTFVIATWSSSMRVEGHALASTSFGVSAMIATGAFEVASSLMVFGATSSRSRREVTEVDELIRRGSGECDLSEQTSKSDTAAPGEKIERISVIDATYQYSDGRLLGPFTFDFAIGKSYLILGESGVGKTTLAYLVSGFVKPSSGRISICRGDGSEVDIPSNGICFQGEEVDIFNTSLRSNLMIANDEVSEAEMVEVVRRVGLSYLLDEDGLNLSIGAFGRGLSGGEARRIAIARSILSKCEVMIFDEPTSGVDGDMATLIVEEITRISKGGAIVVVISHDRSIARLFDEVVLLH
ncbi:MAG: ATP-binding cassette domain-containing protein [Actinomycetota bacterium]|nr:ATP-binding cassette domain-containing protein [Actinomycetota bacterium]